MNLLTALAVDDVTRWVPPSSWLGPNSGSLRVPIGEDARGQPVWLNMTPPSEGGHGRHGWLAGMPISVRNSVLCTIALGLCARYSPEYVKVALLNGSRNAQLAGLPHVVLRGVEPAADAQALAELIDERERRWESQPGDQLSGAAHLVVLLSAESLSAAAPVAERILRRGAALRIHLLVCSESGSLPSALMFHRGSLGYRLALRMSDARHSREVIGSDDALKLRRGEGILSVASSPGHDEQRWVRFFDTDDPGTPEGAAPARPIWWLMRQQLAPTT